MTRSTIAAWAAFFMLLCTTPSEARRHSDSPLPVLDRHSPSGWSVAVHLGRTGPRQVSRHALKSAKRGKVARHSANAASGVLGLDSPVKASGDLLELARRYLGTNPTGWRSVWCGRFVAMIAPETAKRVKNPNWARDWAELPRVARRIGAIVVLSRGRGGHIGIVAGFGRRGPIIISGNHGHRVGIGEYPESRVLAYVSGRG